MRIHRVHNWNSITVKRARQLQITLAQRVVIEGAPSRVKTIAAGDMAFSKKKTAYAAVVLLSYPEMELIELHTGREDVRFPYVPGYLSFREAPLLLRLFEMLTHTPDLVMIDGQGIAHPRRLGLATHIGLFLKIPTIGVAKSRLVGEYEEPATERGSWSWLVHNDERIGIVLRTRQNVKPIFVSPGNMIDFQSSLKWVLKTSGKYRIPEPTRRAHREVSQFKKQH